MNEILPNAVYTTSEARKLLKISESTIKRLLKKGIIRAYKLGGHYRILGKEILLAVSPDAEKRVSQVYGKLKNKTKKTIKNW